MPAGSAESASGARPPVSTFVIRLWWEWSAAEPQWRGRIDHVQSGESGAFIDIDGLLDFMRRFGALAAAPRRPSEPGF